MTTTTEEEAAMEKPAFGSDFCPSLCTWIDFLTWHMKLGMTLWKEEPLKPKPFSPVQRARKFSEVFGTTSARSWTEIEESFLIANQQWREFSELILKFCLTLFCIENIQ